MRARLAKGNGPIAGLCTEAGKGRHEAGVFLLGVDGAGQKEVRQAVYYHDLDPHAYDSGVCVLHGDAFARLWSIGGKRT